MNIFKKKNKTKYEILHRREKARGAEPRLLTSIMTKRGKDVDSLYFYGLFCIILSSRTSFDWLKAKFLTWLAYIWQQAVLKYFSFIALHAKILPLSLLGCLLLYGLVPCQCKTTE
jgi:hypothetical protein